jgi:hypothetical protein
MSTDDERMSLDELDRLHISHVPMTMITSAEDEQPLEEFLSGSVTDTIQTRTVQVCRECFMRRTQAARAQSRDDRTGAKALA